MSSSALAPIHPNGAALLAPDPGERRRLLGDLVMKNGTEAQVDLVMHLCQHYQLDPLLKHLILINGSAYITRDGLLHIAHQSGQFDGIEVALSKLDDGEWAATCSVYRKDKSRPFRYTVYQREHQQRGGAWDKFPRAMLTKAAEVACLRRAFDVSLGAAEELGYDGQSSQTAIGPAVTIVGELVEDDPPPAAPTLMLSDAEVARLVAELHAQDQDGIAFPAIKTAAQAYANRATDEQWADITAAVKAIAAKRRAAKPAPASVAG